MSACLLPFCLFAYVRMLWHYCLFVKFFPFLSLTGCLSFALVCIKTNASTTFCWILILFIHLILSSLIRLLVYIGSWKQVEKSNLIRTFELMQSFVFGSCCNDFDNVFSRDRVRVESQRSQTGILLQTVYDQRGNWIRDSAVCQAATFNSFVCRQSFEK